MGHEVGMERLGRLVSTQPESVAIAALGGGPLTYAGLAGMMDFVGGGLRRAGIGRNDVVGIVTPNGPMAATSFLSVSNAATAAPLNPTYREAEFEFYMDDLEMKAIVIPEGGSGAAEKVATTRGITIIRPNPTPEQGAGAFEIDSQESLKEQATFGRRSADPPYVGHNLTPEDGPAHTPEPGCICDAHRRHAASHT